MALASAEFLGLRLFLEAVVVGRGADISRISLATAALAAALAERCVSRISRASVALAAALRQQNFFGLRLFLEGFFLQSRDGLGWA